MRRSFAAAVMVSSGLLLTPAASTAGVIFVTGHDPDFHASLGGNQAGAQHIIQLGLGFVRDGNTAPILVLQSNTNNNSLGDHTDSLNGLIASGYTAGATPGNHYVVVNSTQFATANLSQYSALFIPSDHGGSLTGPDILALNARTQDIINYLNAGGGLFAAAEDGNHTDGSAPLFGFLPFLVTSSPLSQTEVGNTVTPFGASLGLVNSDVNGNASHNIFTSTGGMSVVDVDSRGEILSLGYRGQIGLQGVVGTPEPASLAVLAVGVFGVLGAARRHRSARPGTAA